MPADDRARQRAAAAAAARRRARRQLGLLGIVLAMALAGGVLLGGLLARDDRSKLTTRDVTIAPVTVTRTVATLTLTVP